MNNSEIWNRVSKTDPSATKKGKVNGMDITTINGVYMVKRATDIFGPIGKGWGYEIVEDRYDDAGPIYNSETQEIICHGSNHTIRLKFWYKDGDEKHSFEHYGHTKHIYRSKYGFNVDEEAPKKSLTDAIKKCLSQLGFCADIYMGMFDDYAYVEYQKEQEALDNAENKIEEEAKQAASAKKHLEDTIRLIEESTTMSMLEGLYKTAAKKLHLRKDKEGLLKLEAAKDKKKKELSNDKAA